MSIRDPPRIESRRPDSLSIKKAVEADDTDHFCLWGSPGVRKGKTRKCSHHGKWQISNSSMKVVLSALTLPSFLLWKFHFYFRKRVVDLLGYISTWRSQAIESSIFLDFSSLRSSEVIVVWKECFLCKTAIHSRTETEKGKVRFLVRRSVDNIEQLIFIPHWPVLTLFRLFSMSLQQFFKKRKLRFLCEIGRWDRLFGHQKCHRNSFEVFVGGSEFVSEEMSPQRKERIHSVPT